MSAIREKVEKVKIEPDYGHKGLNQIGGGGGGGGEGGRVIRPCAACKQMRRRCSAKKCPFSPYFPPSEPLRFASVHRVFGASNVSKMLAVWYGEVPESLRAEVAISLVYEADARLRDPVYGCTAEISALQRQVESLQQLLNSAWDELLKYKNPHHEADIFNAEPPPSHGVALLPSVATTAAFPPPPSPTVLLVPPPPPTSSGSLLLSSSASSNQYCPLSAAADFSTISN
nr:LOB domain-containing protein 3-like [Coffea arabica]